MTPPEPDDSPYLVRITMRDIYESVKTTEVHVANLANNFQHAEDWRTEADRDIRDLFTKTATYVTRRELYSVVGLVAAVVSAASPFLAQLYTR